MAEELQTFNVVVTDILMPQQDGLETILHVQKRQPDAKVTPPSGRLTSRTWTTLAAWVLLVSLQNPSSSRRSWPP
jgi:DNA-binding NarL/FixJ family response regulator